jgi:PAS domain-containing protein
VKKNLSGNEDTFKYMEKLLELRTKNLHKANEELTRLLKLIPVIIYECSSDRTGRTIYIHKSVKEITGYSPEEYIATPDFWFSRIYSEDVKGILVQLATFPEKGKLSPDYRWKIADGTYRRFSDHFQLTLN